jgi:outer membrane receptor protein involved in Fe transport
VPAAIANQSSDYGMLLPSASAKIEVTPSDRITISGARTNRRPRLDYLSPVTLEEEVGDSDLKGNPQLKPESAWGFDVGYEHRIGKTGVAGVNFFYRDIKDLVELAVVGAPGSEGAGTFIYQPQNIGDGQVYGVEFDLSTNLGFLGLKDTGVFGNFSYLESDIRDDLGKRRFNGQSKFVYNVGAIQNIPSIGGAFGVTYRKQGAAYDRVIAEEVRTTYGADLEVFIEKRFGNWLTIRAVGSNLLNGHKNETFNKFDNLEDQIDRKFDEYEIETEKAGPVFQLMARAAF